MDIQPDAVPEAVPEATLVAGVVDDVARDLVRVTAGHSDVQGLNGFGLRLQHGAVQPLHLVIRLAQHHRAGHVGTVAVPARAEIHGEEGVGSQLAVARHAVRLGGIGARHRDGLKSRPLGAVRAHIEFQLQCDLQFGALRRDEVENVGKGIVRQLLRLRHERDLVRVLYKAQGVEQAGGAGHQLHAGEGLGEPDAQGAGHRFLLVGKVPDGVLFQQSRHAGQHTALRHDDLDPDRACRGARHLDIAEIRQQVCRLRQDEHIAVRVVQPGQVALVDLGGDEHRLHLARLHAGLQIGKM